MSLNEQQKEFPMAQAIVTKFIAPTNSRGARIKVSSWQGNKFYSYDYAANDPHKAAFELWLKEKNEQMAKDYEKENWFSLIAYGSNPDGTGNTYIVI